MEIDSTMNDDNVNYLGYDEDCNGNWSDFFMCPNCKHIYITIFDTSCDCCNEKIIWLNKEQYNEL